MQCTGKGVYTPGSCEQAHQNNSKGLSRSTESGGGNKGVWDGGEGNRGTGASSQESLPRETTPPREEGIIEQMEREAVEAGLWGWFNREDQRIVESWSGPSSDVSASQDWVHTMVLTTIRFRTLLHPVRIPNNVAQLGILILLMEGPLKLYKCLMYSQQGSPP